MNLLLRLLCLASLALLTVRPLLAQSLPEGLAGQSWEQVKTAKEGQLLIFYQSQAPFNYIDERGKLSGISYDLTGEFVKFIIKKYDVALAPIWLESPTPDDIANSVSGLQTGALGLAALPMQSPVPQGIAYTAPYMKNADMLVCSAQVPEIGSENDLKAILPKLKPLAVKGSPQAQRLRSFQSDFFPQSEIQFAANFEELTNKIAENTDAFALVPAAYYYLALKRGQELRQLPFWGEEAASYALMYPQGSDWAEPLNAFFEHQNFKPNATLLVKKHLGLDAALLIWEKQEAAPEEANSQAAAPEAAPSLWSGMSAFFAGTAVSALLFLLVYFYLIKRQHREALAGAKAQVKEAEAETAKLEAFYEGERQLVGRLQENMLPAAELAPAFAEHFLLNLPREHASGDFFMFAAHGPWQVLAIADSPAKGAQAPWLLWHCRRFFDRAVASGITQPVDLLVAINRFLLTELAVEDAAFIHQEGIEMAVCSIDTTARVLQFAGAHSSMYLVNGGRFHHFKGSKPELGKDERLAATDFETTEHRYAPNDVAYLFTDGFQDQLGGQGRSKYMPRHFRELLYEISDQPLAQQHKHLDRELANWRGKVKQTDDVLIVGLRL